MADLYDDSLTDDGRLVTSGEPRAGSNVTDVGTKIVTARGTEDGLILRIDGRAEWHEILTDLEAFLGGRKRFFEGGEVSIEWLDRLPTVEQTKELEVFLRTNFGMEVSSRRKRTASLTLASGALSSAVTGASGTGAGNIPGTLPGAGPSTGVPQISGSNFPGGSVAPLGKDAVTKDSTGRSRRRDATTIQLFDEVLDLESPRSEAKFEQLRKASGRSPDSLDSMIERELIDPSASDGDFGDLSRLGLTGGDLSGRKYASRMGKMLGDDLFYEDDANAKVVFGTLRSGQRLETPFSLIVIGDVNPGADLVAGGDIVVFGSLKGTAHASAYDDDAFDRVIVALQMQPMQLRIGSVISRGSDEVVKGAEIARIENRRIIVEAFNPRAMLGKKIR